MVRILLIAVLLLGLVTASAGAGAADDAKMIYRYAPVIYQQDDEKNPAFTVVNYDHDWRANNNADNLLFFTPEAAVYYSLVESDTHYFIGYYLYYPRYAGGNPHEHDMSGVMAIVRKGSGEPTLEYLLAYNHNDWLKRKGSSVGLENGHPVLTVTAGAHEIGIARPHDRILDVGGAYPNPLASSSGGPAQPCGYRLVDLWELWKQRNDIGPNRTFSRWGYFDSKEGCNASAPWVWEYHRTNWLANPAGVEALIHSGSRPEKYINNPYAPIS